VYGLDSPGDDVRPFATHPIDTAATHAMGSRAVN